MAVAKSKKVKKVTEIPEASVKIEVEEKEDEAQDTDDVEKVEEVEEEKDGETEEVEKEDEVHEESSGKDTVEPQVENFDEENSNISWKKVFLYTIIAAGVGFLILAGFFFISKNYDLSFSKKDNAKSIELPSTAPTPTTEEINKEAYEIEVLNGSGIAGEAAAVQALLEESGFSVSGIGNAETSDFTNTQILAGEDVNEEYLAELEKTLEERGPVELEDAPSDQTQDVVVIVGSETE